MMSLFRLSDPHGGGEKRQATAALKGAASQVTVE
jgi:hypothetical protein